MIKVLLVVHLLIALAMVGVILMQRSEGGALGIGGSPGGFMTGRQAGNLLTRTTAILAATFMVTSLALAILASKDRGPAQSLFGQPASTEGAAGSAGPMVPGPAPLQPVLPLGESGPGVIPAPIAPAPLLPAPPPAPDGGAAPVPSTAPTPSVPATPDAPAGTTGDAGPTGGAASAPPGAESNGTAGGTPGTEPGNGAPGSR